MRNEDAGMRADMFLLLFPIGKYASLTTCPKNARKVSEANKPLGRGPRSGRAVRYSKPPLGRAEQRSSVRIKTLALFERSEFASVPNAASSARHREAARTWLAFFLVTFFLATQKKSNSAAGPKPGLPPEKKKPSLPTSLINLTNKDKNIETQSKRPTPCFKSPAPTAAPAPKANSVAAARRISPARSTPTPSATRNGATTSSCAKTPRDCTANNGTTAPVAAAGSTPNATPSATNSASSTKSAKPRCHPAPRSQAVSAHRINTLGTRINRARQITFQFNGRSYSGFAGDTLASALLAGRGKRALAFLEIPPPTRHRHQRH